MQVSKCSYSALELQKLNWEGLSERIKRFKRACWLFWEKTGSNWANNLDILETLTFANWLPKGHSPVRHYLKYLSNIQYNNKITKHCFLFWGFNQWIKVYCVAFQRSAPCWTEKSRSCNKVFACDKMIVTSRSFPPEVKHFNLRFKQLYDVYILCRFVQATGSINREIQDLISRFVAPRGWILMA